MAKNRQTENEQLLRALAHPMRRAILREIADEQPVSPSELAPKLEESISNVSYHFRALAESPAVTLVEERQVRGARQHFYQWVLNSGWARKLLEEPEE